VIRSVVRYTIIIMVIVAALGQLGVQTASILAALGGAALAIGLALQGTLANIAAGLMLLWLRPFRVGDYIETDAVAGTVEEVNLFNSRIKTWDGIYKFVPNSELWSTTITNYTRNPTRLILIEFGIDYENSIGKARKILADFAARHPQVLADPPVQVVPLTLGDSSVVLQLRAWSNTTDFWATRWDLTEGGKNELEASGLTIPFPQHVIHFADPSTAPPRQVSKPPQQPQQSAPSDPNRQESAEE
jgi:small conductance mechanosensitive channel